MPEVSLNVLEFARDMYRRVIDDLLDDCSDLLHPEREVEPAAEITAYRKLGTELGLDFDELVGRGTTFQQERVKELETLVNREMTERYLRRPRPPSTIIMRARVTPAFSAQTDNPTKTAPHGPGWPYRPLNTKPPGTIPHR